MAVNQKAVRVLNKVFEAGFTDEKAISAMTMDDMLYAGITVADIGLINDLQKSIKANKVISYLGVVQMRRFKDKADKLCTVPMAASTLWERRYSICPLPLSR